MTKQRQYEVLTNARGHLAAGWLAHQIWLPTDTRYGTGPVCATGALLRSTGSLEVAIHNYYLWNQQALKEPIERLHNAAVSLFGPPIKSACRHPAVVLPVGMDVEHRHVEVNNDLGQAAILSVFDRAIAELEAELVDETARPLIESVGEASAATPAPVRLGHEDWTYE